MSETRLTSAPARAGTMVGATLGNYRILGALSTGGMGRVFRAQHEILGRPAAVKLLKPELSGNDELVQRFFNEAKAATAIRHPGIVEVYDFGYTEEGHAYIVMEFLEGKPLSRALKKVGRFAEWEAANIGRGIASALKAAHTKGIIHRDLKPDNVFLEPDLEGPTGSTRAKVLDFGIAKLNDMHRGSGALKTQAGILLGTPLYMAPEQARAAADIDHRADLYSLGCIMFELLVGRPPFVAEGAGEIIAMQMFTEPVKPSIFVEDLSPEMENLVLKLLAKEPHDRPQSAGEVVAAFDAMGVRMSAELRTPYPNNSAAHRNVDLQSSGVRAKAVPSTQNKPVSLRELQATVATAPPRSSLPLIAGTATLLIAIGILVFVLVTRLGGDEVGEPEAPVQASPDPAPQANPVTPPPKQPEAKVVGDPPLTETKIKDEPAPKQPPKLKSPDGRPIEVVPDRPPRKGTVQNPPKKPPPNGPVSPKGLPIEDSLDDKPKKP
jgi:serine/threonine protein kinase